MFLGSRTCFEREQSQGARLEVSRVTPDGDIGLGRMIYRPSQDETGRDIAQVLVVRHGSDSVRCGRRLGRSMRTRVEIS